MITTNKDQQIFESIFNLIRTLRTKNPQTSKGSHLSMVQVHTLTFIKERQPIAMHEIAESFQVTKPTATSIIDVLEKDGYVERMDDKNDRRITRIKLSKKGDDFFTKGLNKAGSKVSKLLSYISQEEKEDLMRIINKINAKLEEDYEKTK
jgi:DNA-binding MarR family transcriptional regulator